MGTALNTVTYGYDTQWKDKLTSVGDQTITYDNLGNPISYMGATLTWEGRNLISYETEKTLLQYEYDENGMRYRTTATDKDDGQVSIFEYVWVDSKLISTVYTTDEVNATVKYLYNDFNEPVGMVITDDGSSLTYLYLKNAQGDITHIVDSNGKLQVSYTYDAWGKRNVKYHSDLSTTIGLLLYPLQLLANLMNPFGYRGYCYDSHTGLYYLQSRYYDTNTGRFINADDTNYLNVSGTVLGCNLFAYCENDPVNNVDPGGTAYRILSVYYFYSKKYYIATQIDYLIGRRVVNSLAVGYVLDRGIIQINNSKSDIKRIINKNWSYYLAKGVYNVAKGINNKYLKGRTVKGIQLEILVHYYCYKLGIKVSSSEISHIGGTNVDKNARIFEMGRFLDYLSFLAVASNPAATFAVVMLFASYL